MPFTQRQNKPTTGCRPEDFAQFHPEGTLGRRLLLRAADVMHCGERLPVVRASDAFDHALVVMTNKSLGLAVIVDEAGKLIGVFTDGDLRRLSSRVRDWHVLDARAAHAQSRRPTGATAVVASTIRAELPAIECLRLMREQQITSLVVIDDDDKPIGLVRLQDVVNAGLA
ncbi:MAG: CBS domain-containing protein [Phycisphaerales bacterium]|nr:CBS domain-containing protein [Phycisphaerales bacterium]